MTTAAMAARMRKRLARETGDDDFYDYPDEFYEALTDAHNHFRRLVAKHRPSILYEAAELAALDGGDTFTLPHEHLGKLEAWFEPGPPFGQPLYPSLPEKTGHYYQEGLDLKMIGGYSGNLHVRYVKAEVDDLDADNNSTLPVYLDSCIIEWAMFQLAQKEDSGISANKFRDNARRYWRGDSADLSDTGVLGILEKQSAHQARETVSADWWGDDEDGYYSY